MASVSVTSFLSILTHGWHQLVVDDKILHRKEITCEEVIKDWWAMMTSSKRRTSQTIHHPPKKQKGGKTYP